MDRKQKQLRGLSQTLDNRGSFSQGLYELSAQTESSQGYHKKEKKKKEKRCENKKKRKGGMKKGKRQDEKIKYKEGGEEKKNLGPLNKRRAKKNPIIELFGVDPFRTGHYAQYG